MKLNTPVNLKGFFTGCRVKVRATGKTGVVLDWTLRQKREGKFCIKYENSDICEEFTPEDLEKVV